MLKKTFIRMEENKLKEEGRQLVEEEVDVEAETKTLESKRNRRSSEEKSLQYLT